MQQQYDDNMEPAPAFLTHGRGSNTPRPTSDLRRRFARAVPAADASDLNMPEPNETQRLGVTTLPRAVSATTHPEASNQANINLNELKKALARSRHAEIAMLVRELTYGEMMELAAAIAKCKPNGAESLNVDNLPMTLHLWATALPEAEAAEADKAAAETSIVPTT